jgi:hypothetical protein
MVEILVINPGSSKWWLSPDIWVTPSGQPSTAVVANPIAGDAYDVWVRVWNKTTAPVNTWNLFVCWAVPTVGSIPYPFANPSLGQQLTQPPFGSPISVPANGFQLFQTPWQPSFQNGGHECLVAVAYNQQIGFIGNSLPGDAGSNTDFSIAQHNLGVLAVGSHMSHRFQYAFQVCNGATEERRFVVTAWQASLSEIDAFLTGVPGGRTVIDKPGKIAGLGVVASAHPDPAELDGATAVLSSVTIAPRSCRPFTLSGSLQKGNALIHVTQSLDERVIGGLSLLVMAEEEK